MENIILALVALGALGAIYQFLSEVRDRKKYPAPGKMFDIGGHKMHLQFMGEHHKKGPTIILEMGGGGNSLHWSLVQPEIAKFARVVTYDRAGYAWSEESPKSRTIDNISTELYNLLHTAQIPGPYILVGHSFGGMVVRLYEKKYSHEVLGVILVDSVHEDQVEIFPPSTDWILHTLKYDFAHVNIKTALFLGLVRLLNIFYRPNKFPKSTYAQILAHFYTGKFVRTALGEYTNFRQSQKQLRDTGGVMGDKPLIVVSAGKCTVSQEFWNSWNIFQKDLLIKSTNSSQIIVPHSGHKVNQKAPEIIIHAIKTMYDDIEKQDTQIRDRKKTSYSQKNLTGTITTI
jgi:pimeloyl-ACP methyl ester carboxylesterase